MSWIKKYGNLNTCRFGSMIVNGICPEEFVFRHDTVLTGHLLTLARCFSFSWHQLFLAARNSNANDVRKMIEEGANIEFKGQVRHICLDLILIST
jgi:hypothetical protein